MSGRNFRTGASYGPKNMVPNQGKSAVNVEREAQLGEVHHQDVIMRNFYLWTVIGPLSRLKNAKQLLKNYRMPQWYIVYPKDTTVNLKMHQMTPNPNFNHVTQHKGRFNFLGTSGQEDFLKIPNDVLSSLVPFVKMSKIDRTRHGSPIYDLPFPNNLMESATATRKKPWKKPTTDELDQILSSQRNMHGCGIVSVDVTQSGSNIASARKIHGTSFPYLVRSVHKY